MVGTSLSGGTSAASPLWASLTVQLDTIFHDQGLPNLGYMNDLLYIAAVIAPASFNDVTLGTNTSSFVLGGRDESGGHAVPPPGFGFNAGPGYDYASGLGTPNGLQLARPDGYRPFRDVVRRDPGRDRLERRGRLDQRRRPEPVVPDHVRRRHPGRRAYRPRRLRLLQRRVGQLCLDEPVGRAIAAARLRSQPGHPVRQAGAGRAGAAELLVGRGLVEKDQHPPGAADPGRLEQPV